MRGGRVGEGGVGQVGYEEGSDGGGIAACAGECDEQATCVDAVIE